MTPHFAYAAKAILAAAIAGTGALATAYADGDLTAAESWTALTAALVALGAVFGIPNGPGHTDEDSDATP